MRDNHCSTIPFGRRPAGAARQRLCHSQTRTAPLPGWLVDMDTELNYTGGTTLWIIWTRGQGSDLSLRVFRSTERDVVSAPSAGTCERVEAAPSRKGAWSFRTASFSRTDGEPFGRRVAGADGRAGPGLVPAQVFGFRPAVLLDDRHCGRAPAVAAEIVAGLGMDALFFCRSNPTDKSAFWWVAPDGTRQLTVTDTRYAEMRPIFVSQGCIHR